jgi:hypothetical protein
MPIRRPVRVVFFPPSAEATAGAATTAYVIADTRFSAAAKHVPDYHAGDDQQHRKDRAAGDPVHSRTSYSNATPFRVVLLEPNLGRDLGREDFR